MSTDDTQVKVIPGCDAVLQLSVPMFMLFLLALWGLQLPILVRAWSKDSWLPVGFVLWFLPQLCASSNSGCAWPTQGYIEHVQSLAMP